MSVTISTRTVINNLPKVRTFLDSVGRNSLKTKKNYETALVHFKDSWMANLMVVIL